MRPVNGLFVAIINFVNSILRYYAYRAYQILLKKIEKSWFYRSKLYDFVITDDK